MSLKSLSAITMVAIFLSACSKPPLDWHELTDSHLNAASESTAQLAAHLSEYCDTGEQIELGLAREQWLALAGQWIPYQALAPVRLEQSNQTFRMHFWPDKKDLTGRQTKAAADASDAFEHAPAPAVGISALEWLLYDDPELQLKHCDWAIDLALDFQKRVAAIAEQPVGEEMTTLDYQVNALSNLLAQVYKRVEGLTRDGKALNSYGMEGWRSGTSLQILERMLAFAAEYTEQLAIQTDAEEAKKLAAELSQMATTDWQMELDQLNQLRGTVKTQRAYLSGPLAQALEISIGFNNSDGD